VRSLKQFIKNCILVFREFGRAQQHRLHKEKKKKQKEKKENNI
jgi:hypothetical protein